VRSGYQKGKHTLVILLSEKLLWFSVNADCTLFTMGPRNLRLMSPKCSLSWASPSQLSRGRVNWFLNFPRCYPAAMGQHVSGAIFTTDWNSTFVNANVYDFKEDVYLSGGPRPNAPCTAAGLPDGQYYFQVTDPSGHQLLSTDDITNRHVTVTGGLIDAHSGTHGIGIGKCVGFNQFNITVQLYPFLPTPNPGGEYKAWMTKVGDYDMTMTKGSFGFIPSKSKTDNFKVASPVDIDSDGDGISDADDRCPFDPDPSCLEG
jgi:hypothetical protein